MKIAQVELFAVYYPTVGRFKFFEGPDERYGRPAVVVKLTSDDGTVGWGQSIPSDRWSDETLETTLSVLRDYFGPAVLGRDPTDILAANAALDAALAPGFSIAMPLARAGVDMALYDLAGKLLDKSLAELVAEVFDLWSSVLGNVAKSKDQRPKSVTLSWTLNPRTLDEAEVLIEQGRQRGYRHFNIKVAPDVQFDVALATLVRRLVPDGFLWADANGGYDPATALEAAPRLAEAGVDVLESPLRPNRLSGYQALKRQGALPILMDEGVLSTVELDEFIGLGMLDGVAMKPARSGGITGAARQIALVLDRGLLWLGSGLSDPDIALAASVALYSALGQTRPCALNGPQFIADHVLAEPLQVVDGTIAPPSGPGLGIVVDEGRLRELAMRTQLRPLAPVTCIS